MPWTLHQDPASTFYVYVKKIMFKSLKSQLHEYEAKHGRCADSRRFVNYLIQGGDDKSILHTVMVYIDSDMTQYPGMSVIFNDIINQEMDNGYVHAYITSLPKSDAKTTFLDLFGSQMGVKEEAKETPAMEDGHCPSFEERLDKARILVIGAGYGKTDEKRLSQLDPNYIGLFGALQHDAECAEYVDAIPIQNWNEHSMSNIIKEYFPDKQFETALIDRSTMKFEPPLLHMIISLKKKRTVLQFGLPKEDDLGPIHHMLKRMSAPIVQHLETKNDDHTISTIFNIYTFK